MRDPNESKKAPFKPGLPSSFCDLRSLGLAAGLALVGIESAEADTRASLGLPVGCRLGIDCFVQQMPDIDPSPDVLDPLCGKASYQGHDGWDIRLRSLDDIAQEVPVLAVANGRVARVRDGVMDQIYDDAKDKARVADNECGNGVVVEHARGLSSQYCHLKKGSVLARLGAQVQKGQRIGAIGSSGAAAFPHVHLSVRLDDKPVEPLTGKPLGSLAPGCGDLSGSLFEPTAAQALNRPAVAILDAGLTSAATNLPDLARSGGPPLAKVRGDPIVAWLWAINVEEGSRFRIRLAGPDGSVLIDHTTNVLAKRKASYLAYVGRKMETRPGKHSLSVEILRGVESIQSKTILLTISE